MEKSGKTIEELSLELAVLKKENADLKAMYEKDITARIEIEKALSKKTEELDSYFTNALDLFCIANTDGYFIRLNKEWETCLGYSLQELEGSKFLDFIHPDDLQSTLDAVSKLGRQEEVLNFTNRYRAKNGLYRILEWRSFPKGERIYAAARDITKHKKIEEALRLSQITFRGIFDSIHEAIYVQDEEGRFLDVNLAVEKMYGYTRDFLIGKTPELLSAPGLNDFDPVLKAIQSAFNGTPQNFEFWGKAKDGRIFPKEVSVSAGIYFDKKVVLAVARDITERKKAEDSLLNERNLIESIMQTSPVGIVTTTTDGLINYANSRAVALLGLSKDEITQRTYNHPLWKISSPDGKDFPADKLPFAVVKKTGKPVYDIQHAIEWPDGRRILLSINAAPTTDSKGEFTGMIASIDDITKRKLAEESLRESEERWRTIVQSEPECVKLLDSDGRVLEMNPTGLAMIQATFEQVKGKRAVGMVADEDKASFNEMVERVFKGETCHLVFDMIGLGGRRLTLETTSVPLKEVDSSGKVKALLAVTRDISDRKKAEEALRQSEQNLKQINAEKDRFFSIIAHDLRSPFIGLLSLTELMASKSQDFTIAEFAEISRSLNNSAVNVYKLLNNLLEWSLMQQNLVSFYSENFNLSELVAGSIKVIEQRASQKGVSIHNETPDSINVSVDEKMANTVLRNLISNAVKFTEPGGKVVVSAKPQENNMIELSVHDTGIGIPEENLQRLFKIGENVKSKGTDGELSTGLGLILCKEFVEKNGGSIRAESIIGKGSTFYVTLPGN